MDLNNQFRHLYLKLILEPGNNSSDNLNELNSLDYKLQIIDTKYIFEFFDALPEIIRTFDNNTITKLLILLEEILTKQNINLPDKIASETIKWILGLISCSKSLPECFYICQCFKALRSLIRLSASELSYENHTLEILMLSEHTFQLILQLEKSVDRRIFIDVDITPQELQKSALECLDAILEKLEFLKQNTHEEIICRLGELIIESLCTNAGDIKMSTENLSIITLKLNCLKSIVNLSYTFAKKFIGELIGICKPFVSVISLDDVVKRPIKIHPSQQFCCDQIINSNVKEGRSTQNRKKSTNKKNSTVVKSHEGHSASSYGQYKTSDSEYSDAETATSSKRHKMTKLRFVALSLLLSICYNIENRIIFGYWQTLLSTDDNNNSIISATFSKDQSPKCRILALQILICLIKKCKNFLMQADNKDKLPMSFTPFSISLGNTICKLYHQLTLALMKEENLTVLAQILKCISTFVTATPFSRLTYGVVSEFMEIVKKLTRHKDFTIQVAALIIIKNVISIKNVTTEIYEIVQIPKNSKIEFNWKKYDGMLKKNEDHKLIGGEDAEDDEEIDIDEEEEERKNPEMSIPSASESDYQMSWLLQIVLENLGVLKAPSHNTSVKIECLQILSQMSLHFTLLRYNMHDIERALVNSLNAGNDEKLYACKTLETIGNSFNVYLTEDESHLNSLDSGLIFWSNILPNVIEILQDVEQPQNIRSTLADSLSNIGVHVFEKLGKQQLLIISVLTGCSYDENSIVSSSAVRALAVYALYPSMRSDMCFIENTIELILKITSDQNPITRSKASWSMGNVIDALLLAENNSLRNDLLLKVMENCQNALEDCDRVRINGARSIGNIFNFLNENHLKDVEIQKTFLKSITSLSHLLLNSNNDKLKWNICYAFTNVLRNNNLNKTKPPLNKWEDQVFSTLFKTISNSSNFKVRINACAAFKNIERNQIGSYFIDAWQCLLHALEKSTELVDFNEYKHRDELQDKICLSMCHLIEISLSEDAQQMKSSLVPIFDIVKQNWNRVFIRWSPEDQSKMYEAVGYLDKINNNNPAIKFLISCFKPIEIC